MRQLGEQANCGTKNPLIQGLVLLAKCLIDGEAQVRIWWDIMSLEYYTRMVEKKTKWQMIVRN
jgi:hypothetical protein